jgi:hypothetical protein
MGASGPPSDFVMARLGRGMHIEGKVRDAVVLAHGQRSGSTAKRVRRGQRPTGLAGDGRGFHDVGRRRRPVRLCQDSGHVPRGRGALLEGGVRREKETRLAVARGRRVLESQRARLESASPSVWVRGSSGRIATGDPASRWALTPTMVAAMPRNERKQGKPIEPDRTRRLSQDRFGHADWRCRSDRDSRIILVL